MKEFMITVRLSAFTPEFVSRIPEQRAFVEKLMLKGIILNYSLSNDRNLLWITMAAKSDVEVISHLADFPLIKFMKIDITPLMFHLSPEYVMPEPSLN